MHPQSVCIVGLGYIGLPTAALLANSGLTVFGCDQNPHVVATINRGDVHIVEPDLESAVRTAVETGRLHATAEPQSADVFLICVPTPFREGGVVPEPDLDAVLAASRAIAPYVGQGALVILESTSPVGTTRRVAAELERAGVDVTALHIAYCPERVLPGRIMTELVDNDRIVGGLTPEATERVANFYRGFVRGAVLTTDAATAEMCKLTENTFRDVNIAIANELSIICDKAGIDVWDVIALANRHPRVNILNPGVGVGGHCIAVDPWFIVASNIADSRLIRTAREVNDRKSLWVGEQIIAAAQRFELAHGRAPRIACLGLTFKPDIDDLRESPALAIAERLLRTGLSVTAVEPHVDRAGMLELEPLQDAVALGDIICLLVNHRQFAGARRSVIDAGKEFLNFCGPTSGAIGALH